MRNKRLLLVIIVCCVSLLSVDAFANKAAAARKIFKNAGKATKDFEFLRPGAYITSKHLYKQRLHDSLYYDSLSKQVRSQRLYNSMNVPPFELDEVNTKRDFRNALLPKSSDEALNVRERNFSQNYVPSYWDSLKYASQHPQKNADTPTFEIESINDQVRHKGYVVKENSKVNDSRALEEYTIDFMLIH